MQTLDWAHAGPAGLAAFLASLVEFIEAMTIILAVGATRGWKSAIGVAALGLAVLLALVLVLGPALLQVPQPVVQLVVGALLLLFGMRWLRKAILRSAGTIPLHDEDAAFAKAAAGLRGGPASGWDRLAVATSFKITMLEGIEVVFIVVAVGVGGPTPLVAAAAGAATALLAVVLLGLAVHRPIARIPENTLKFMVGVLLCAFGTFWAGEGIGIDWPAADGSLLVLAAAYLAAAAAAVPFCRPCAA